MSTSLQSITDAWGRWMAGKYGVKGIKFTSSLNYKDHKELDNYHQYEVASDVKGIIYDPGAPDPQDGYAFSKRVNYKNGSGSEQTVNYSDTMTTEKSFQWSVTESIDIGQSTTISVGIPELAEGSETITVNLSLSATQGGSYSNSQSWTVDWPLVIQPKTKLSARMIVTIQKYNIKWAANVAMKGRVAIWFDQKVALNRPGDLHWLWFVDLAKVFRDCHDNNLVDVSGYEIGGDYVIAVARGVFTGSQGVSSDIELVEEPIESETWIESRNLYLQHAINGEA